MGRRDSPLGLQFTGVAATAAASGDTARAATAKAACRSVHASRRIHRFTLQAAPMK